MFNNFYEAIRDYKDKNKKVDIIDELTEKQRKIIRIH